MNATIDPVTSAVTVHMTFEEWLCLPTPDISLCSMTVGEADTLYALLTAIETPTGLDDLIPGDLAHPKLLSPSAAKAVPHA